MSDDDATAFGKLLQQDDPIHAYCRSGMRSTTLWALNQAKQLPLADIVATAKEAGYDMSGVAARIAGKSGEMQALKSYDVLIVGGGAAGISTAASFAGQKQSTINSDYRSGRQTLLPTRLDLRLALGYLRLSKPCAIWHR